ncbi:MAG TPA: hypothetical protein VFH39_00020, partial [Candidatus Saccharimonadales bacterium]|nr:hypothetical protein [Candidatus Saccharimonadales bacterium]
MQKTESPAPTAPLDKKARRIRPLDVAIVVLFVAVVTALILVLLAQLRLKNEVADARAVTDKLITAMKDQDGEAARLLGDPGFRARNSADQMHTIFTESKPYTQGTPVVVRQVVVNGKVNHVVSIYYKFGSQ